MVNGWNRIVVKLQGAQANNLNYFRIFLNDACKSDTPWLLGLHDLKVIGFEQTGSAVVATEEKVIEKNFKASLTVKCGDAAKTDAEVTVMKNGEELQTAEIKNEGEGRYSLAYLSGSVTVNVAKKGYETVTIERVDEFNTVLTAEMNKKYGKLVFTDGGEKVANAAVTYNCGEEKEGVTDADGELTIGWLNEDIEVELISVNHYTFADEDKNLTLTESSPVYEVNLTKSLFNAVLGVFYGETAVTEETITFTVNGEQKDFTTDENGQITFENLFIKGEVSFVKATNYNSVETTNFTFTEETVSANVNLTGKYYRAVVKVTGPENAKVKITFNGEEKLAEKQGDAYVLDKVFGEATVEISAEGYETKSVSLTEDDTEAEVELTAIPDSSSDTGSSSSSSSSSSSTSSSSSSSAGTDDTSDDEKEGCFAAYGITAASVAALVALGIAGVLVVALKKKK